MRFFYTCLIHTAINVSETTIFGQFLYRSERMEMYAFPLAESQTGG